MSIERLKFKKNPSHTNYLSKEERVWSKLVIGYAKNTKSLSLFYYFLLICQALSQKLADVVD